MKIRTRDLPGRITTGAYILPGLDLPAVSRYAATTPRLLDWFSRYNASRPYQEQVRPFNFLLAFQADRLAVLEDRYEGLIDAASVPSQK
jgi:hypothetical protein